MKKSIGAKPIIYPAPVLVVGTYDESGAPNAMTAICGGISCMNPPCVSVSLRSATYSHGSIVNRKAFTINIPSVAQVREADYMGLVSGKDVDKFKAASLTAVRAEHVDAPYIEEFPFSLECKLVNTVELGSHTVFIGEVMDVKAHESALNDKGELDIAKVMPFLFAPGSRAYYAIGDEIGKAFSIGKEISSK